MGKGGDHESYLNFVNGCWTEGSTGQWDLNRNPSKPGSILGQSTRSTTEDVAAAIGSANSAQPEWSRTPRPVRGAIIKKAAEILKDRADLIAAILTSEEGKNINEARGEVFKAISSLEFTASEGRRPLGQVIPSEMPNTLVYTTRSPLGVVGIITPWNFPICIPAWKIGPALLEGNSIVFKPSGLTPACAVELVRSFHKAGLPPGVLNLVFGSGSVVGNAIVHDKRVKAISFTGSNEIGTALNTEASKRLAKVQLEMGGKNPIIVLADADLDQAADATIQGAFGSTGQRCTATSRLIVERSVQAEIVQKLIHRIRMIEVGDGLINPQAMGPVVDENQFKSILIAIEKGKKEGATLLYGGAAAVKQPEDNGFFIQPTLFDDVTPEMSLAQQEVFGPVLAIIPVENFQQAIRVANSVEYGLSSSIYTRDIQRVMKYVDEIETGILHVNSPTVGGEVQAPFGGMKSTGTGGREMGSTGPEFFSEIKTIYIDYNSAVRKGNLY